MNNKSAIIKAVIGVLCVVALVYLIFFFGNGPKNDEQVTTLALKRYTISFDTSHLEYEKGIDFMQGVSATDENGADLTEFVTVSCNPTDNMYRKTLSYSINKAGYKIESFERALILSPSYSGPTVSATDSIEISLDEINNLSSAIQKSGAIQADDGVGNECSISASIEADEITLGDYVATVTAQNIFGDTATTKISVTVTEPKNSIIKLKASSITINRGDKFDPMEYLLSAKNDEYGDLTPYIVATDNVDTSKSDSYVVEYRIKGIPELSDEVARLFVTIN